MKKTRKELEAQLEEQSKQMIRELLDWNETHTAPDLTQIEDIVLELRQKLSKAMVESVVESQEQVQPVEMRCPKCGGVMRYKGHKGKVGGIHTSSGSEANAEMGRNVPASGGKGACCGRTG